MCTFGASLRQLKLAVSSKSVGFACMSGCCMEVRESKRWNPYDVRSSFKLLRTHGWKHGTTGQLHASMHNQLACMPCITACTCACLTQHVMVHATSYGHLSGMSVADGWTSNATTLAAADTPASVRAALVHLACACTMQLLCGTDGESIYDGSVKGSNV